MQGFANRSLLSEMYGSVTKPCADDRRAAFSKAFGKGQGPRAWSLPARYTLRYYKPGRSSGCDSCRWIALPVPESSRTQLGDAEW